MAAGKGCSGASQYSGNSTRIPAARPSRAASYAGSEGQPLRKGDADMPSQAMQDAIDARRERRKDSAGQPPPTLEQCRAAFTRCLTTCW